MRNSRALRTGATFVGLLLITYLVVVFCLSIFYVRRSPLLQLVIGNDSAAGGIGHTLQRLREVESVGSVDILFIGSSHAYRGFDPRLFAETGLTSFNLGSKAQSPLNSYFLLKHYWPRLRPKLVVMEVYPMAFVVDGLESFYDLTVNSSLSLETLQMALAEKNPHAINAMVSAYVGSFWRPIDGLKQADVLGQRYISGGYVESTGQSGTSKMPGRGFEIHLSRTQLEYLKVIVAFIRAQGSRIILVIHPLPRRYLSSIQNYWATSELISTVARQLGVPFWDFNQDLRLDDDRDFKDLDHLNAAGVKVFNQALIDRMKQQGYLN